MARISLLFSLAFVLVLGSLFLSVSGHAPPVPPRKSACPKTVSELQTLPFTQITEILNRKERSAPKTAEFKAMFTMCKDYVAYLESLYKFENPIVDVLGIAKARYALMTKAVLAAQASVSPKVDKKTSLKLKKSYADLTKGFLQIKETIVKISAKHQFNADAKITAQESKKLNHTMINFKKSINAFMNVVDNLEKNKMKKIGHHARALKDDQEDHRVRSAFERFFKKFGGYLGGKTHGRELTEAVYNADSHVGADVKGFESIYESISHFFGGYLGGQTHGRELYVVDKDPSQSAFDKYFKDYFGEKARGKTPKRELFIVGPANNIVEASAGVNAAAPTSIIGKDVSQSTWDKYFEYYFGEKARGKAHGRKLFIIAPAPTRVNVAAPTSIIGKDVSQSTWDKYFEYYFGEKARGKAHGRELFIVAPAPTGINVAAPTSIIGKDVSQSTWDKYFEYYFGEKARGKAHGRELFIVAPAPTGVNVAAPTSIIGKDVSQSTWDKYFEYYFGEKARGKAHGRELFIVAPAPTGVNVASPTSIIGKDVSQSTWDKYFEYYFGEKARGKAHRRGLYTQAPASEKVNGSFDDFFNVGFGGKVQYDAAGKMKVAGEDGFRSLNRAHYKHFASTKA